MNKDFIRSCDTFVALGNSTKNGKSIFGKNSDRPQSEAQLITYIPRTKYSNGDELKCTYISIPQIPETVAVLLSQPYWMYGAEMGANEHGVTIGNEAVHSKEPLRETGLLGMDLLRLGLERGKTASEALKVITELLEKYGQGGSCSVDSLGWSYHNSFIIADVKEAFVLDTADMWWIVEKVNDVRSISNNLSIRGKGDLRKEGIIQHAIEKGYCKDDNNFDFAKIFSQYEIPDTFPPICRDGKSMQLLTQNKGEITPALMMDFLREHEVGICMHGSFESTGSQVSELDEAPNKSIHWFTGSTTPCLSIFKPYNFPADEYTFLKAGPYGNVNPDWFWSKHADVVRRFGRRSKAAAKEEYVKGLKKIESQLIANVEKAQSKEDQLSDEDFNKKIKVINIEGWRNSLEAIK